MSLLKQIEQDFIKSLKEKNTEQLSLLRLLKSAIKNKSIELGADISQDQVIQLIKSEVKKRRESIEAYVSGGRQELADKEQREINFLQIYLPAQMSEQEIKTIIASTVETWDNDKKQNFGLVMRAVMQALKGSSDGQTVSRLVKEFLGQ